MAKIPKINQEKTSKQSMPNNFNPATSAIKTQNLAFVVPAVSMEVLLNEKISGADLLEKLEDLGLNGLPTNPDNLDHHLTGIQFEFEEVQGDKIVNVLQVYYVNSINKFIRYQDENNAVIINLLSNDSKRTIFEHKPISLNSYSAKTSHHSLEELNSTTQLNFENLDFFSEHHGDSVEFVYFAVNQIRPLIESTAATNGEIILSGSQLNLGKKLTSDGETSLYEGKYFSLKMEGKSGPGNSGSISKTNNSGAEVTAPPGIALSVPCPPEWYYLGNLYIAALLVNKKAPHPKLENGHIGVRVRSTNSPSNNNDQS